MAEVFFTSDTHLGHANVIRYCNRPYPDVEAMDEALIANWNARVKGGDVVYHLGDFALVHQDKVEPYVRRLNGQIHLVFGNHDRFLKSRGRAFGFAWIGPYKRIEVGKQKIVLCHYPFLTWHGSHRGSWSLHGHCHGTLPRDMTQKRLDVGVDPNGYRPLSYDEVRVKMDEVKFEPVDHHREM